MIKVISTTYVWIAIYFPHLLSQILDLSKRFCRLQFQAQIKDSELQNYRIAPVFLNFPGNLERL